MGFFAWKLDAVDLIELYDLQITYLTTALEKVGRSQLMSLDCNSERLDVAAIPHEGAPPVARLEAVLAMLVTEARSAALARAHGLLADRLAPSRRVEPTVFHDAAEELAILEQAVVMSDRPTIARILKDYHCRLKRHAPQIVVAMRASVASVGVSREPEAAARCLTVSARNL